MRSWQDLFRPHILERGYGYFAQGRVRELKRTEDGCSAIVKGTEDYEVEIRMEGGSVAGMSCSCPYAQEEDACKHMAAVLFAADAAGYRQNSLPPKQGLTPEALVQKIPESRLRPLLAEWASADEKLYRELLLRYGELPLEECRKTLKKELTSIEDRYTDWDGFVGGRDAEELEGEMADFIVRQTETLLERGEPLLALQMGMDVLRKFADYDLEERGCLVEDALDEMLEDILSACREDEAAKALELLLSCTEAAGESWLVREFAEQALASAFPGEEANRKKLELTDRQIAALAACEKQDTFGEDEMTSLLLRRYDLMKELNFSKEELDAFLAQHTNCSEIRMLRVRQALSDGKRDEAAFLLKEGKAAARDRRGLAAQYSEALIYLYERWGQRDELIAELEYHIFALSRGGMEMLNRLKNACAPAQWLEYRERYLCGENRHTLELMESEGLWERLMKAVRAAGVLSVMDRYEPVLRERYPEEMLDAYLCVLAKEAAAARDRKQYQWLAQYLKKLESYPNAQPKLDRLAGDWHTRYARRRAMMEELGMAGY